MFYIVGLGNPGAEYENTRHNVGFILTREVAKALGFSSFNESSAHSGLVANGMVKESQVTALLPTTFMNNSGSAVQKLVVKGTENRLIVIYDDIDLPLGSIRISFGRGDGGHNGVKSIVAKLGTSDFIRIRIGIAKKTLFTGKPIRPKGEKLASFVLAKFGTSEKKQLAVLGKIVSEAVVAIVEKGKEEAMNKFN